jgi:diaminohydroxyphosphoribosylaminopyrimidine deaminase/5-amino-6-(5-phosphoribosylamino)uracil reductase
MTVRSICASCWSSWPRDVNEVLVEAGPRLAGAFAQLGLVDEFQIFIAGKFLGSSARPLLDWPLAQMKDAPS